MDSNLNALYSIHGNQYFGSNMSQGQNVQNITSPISSGTSNDAILNGLAFLGAYMQAGVHSLNAPSSPTTQIGDNGLNAEAERLKRHPKLMSFDDIKKTAKYAVVINDSGRLMVDGNLFAGVIKIETDDEMKYVEYKSGNPITILSEKKNDYSENLDGKAVSTLTKYEYSLATSSYVKETRTRFINVEKCDNPTGELHLAVPKEILEQVGITKEDNYHT